VNTISMIIYVLVGVSAIALIPTFVNWLRPSEAV
jgi:uncharacterized membrane protein YuzA (DUF378 family)